MKRIRIPATLPEAQTELAGLGKLLTAGEWHRAAILAAFVATSPNQAHVKSDMRMSPTEFAALGIHGLRSKNTIVRYVQAWLDAHDGQYPQPGEDVELPTTEWPPAERNTGSRTTTSNIGRQIKESPELAVAAAEAIVDEVKAGRLPDPVVNDLYRATHDRVATADISDRAPANIDDEWATWLGSANALFTSGARLVEKSEQADIMLGGHAAAALELYHRLTERQIDAELRQLIESDGARH